MTGSGIPANAALTAVAFTPATDNDLDTTITTHVQDLAATGPADGTITLDVTPVNEAPTATNLTQTKTFFLMIRRPPISALFPSAPLFRSVITATLTLANPAAGVLTTRGGINP